MAANLNLHYLAGLGDDSVALSLPCLPIGSDGPLQEGQTWCPAVTTFSQSCMPVGSVGPLGPGQVWCDTGSITPSVADTLTPAGTPPSSSISGTTIAIAAAAVVIGVMAMMGGRR
jgi:hypothetical protein